MNKLNPIFLISLPRSGSTLLQKMLTVHPEIHSVAEPWLMLPFAYLQKKEGVKSIYNHKTCYYAIEDFINTLPNKNNDYYDMLGNFIISLYKKTIRDDDVTYFIDKTPRYYLITEFLADVFPTAKFIFLFRNPLEVLSSIVTTWLNDRFTLNRYYIDLFHGPHALALGYNQLKNRSIAVNYNDVVTNPGVELQRLCSYLQIPFDETMIVGYKNIEFQGRLGDQNGINEYNSISSVPINKWKKVLSTRYRKRFSKRYSEYLGDKTLLPFGTSVEKLTSEINTITKYRSGSFKDLLDHLISNIKQRGNILNFKDSLKSFLSHDLNYPYM